jgi:hypothetical protein
MGSRSNTESTKSTTGKPTPWTQAFARTASLPCVFTVRNAHYERVNELVESLDLPTHHRGGVFQTWYWATPLLDGYVLWNSTEGFPAGRLPSGMRVVGINPLRLLCHLLDLTQPRKSLSEDTVPAPETLVALLESQRSKGSESLPTESRSLLFARDTSDLVILGYQLYGEAALPDGYAGSEIPAPGQWGEAGLSRRDYRHFTQANLPLDDAIQWKQLVDPRFLADLIGAGVTLDEARVWHNEGIEVREVPRLKKVGGVVADVKDWEAAGIRPHNFANARDRGLSLDDLRPYLAFGYSDYDAMDLFEHQVPVEMARDLHEEVQPKPWEYADLAKLAIIGMDRSTIRRWVSIGVRPAFILRAAKKSLSIEKVERYARTPRTSQELAQYIRTH